MRAMKSFPLSLTLITALSLIGCGDDAIGTASNVSATEGTDTTGEETTSEAGSQGESSSTTSGDTTTGTTTADETTGNQYCQVSCQEVLELSNFHDPDDYEGEPCFKYQGNKSLIWPEAAESADLSERAGALCQAFNADYWLTSLNVSDLAKMDSDQGNVAMCFEFLGIIHQVPADFQEEVCFDTVQVLIDGLETQGHYQTRVQMPAEYLANGGVYQGIMRIDVGTLKDLKLGLFKMGIEWSVTSPPDLCRLRMDNIVAGQKTTWTSDDQPLIGLGVMDFEVPNKGVMPAGYNIAEVECIITGQQSGAIFGTNGSLYFEGGEPLNNRNHNLYDEVLQSEVINP